MEATQMPPKHGTKNMVVHMYNGILIGHKKNKILTLLQDGWA